LKKKGLLEKNKTIAFPHVPLSIGLITSGNSAAYHDFLNELKSSGYGFRVSFFDSYMQGKLVEESICRGLKYFQKIQDKIDVIVITRGGGATADLAWFDNKKIAESIARCPLPVLTGLGHQIDITVTDLVAHTFVKTPTKAAQFLIEGVTRFIKTIEQYETEMKTWAYEYIEEKKHHLHSQAVQYESLILRYFRDIHTRLATISSGISSYSRHILRNRMAKLTQHIEIVQLSSRGMFIEAAQKLENTKEKVSLLDPKVILKRGYSITTLDGKAVKNSSQVKQGDVLRTHLHKGEVESTVTRNE